ncbi:MAG: SLC13 family permease [Thiofilum sp.]|uniref:SLC13 family permease n=1 Tax=Thiofilum sp. TaxID=2212733 RepID=UPI0025DE7946|nr:SLC13 family permease [Thiofilum sp.]MBK8451867.1 SLC13 family permease [Thiofilum sp.]
MSWEAVLTLAVVVGVLLALALSTIAADLILMAALLTLLVSGVLTANEAFAGFGNTGLMTIAALYIVAAGLRETGAVQCIARTVLGQPKTIQGAQWRLLLPSAGLSAFLNNTTVVAMFMPAVQDWCQRLKLPPSKLLLPLSYAAILGGTCTLIGTSTNLVVNGLLQKTGHAGLGMFDITLVGLAVLITGAGFILLLGNRLLPSSSGVIESPEQIREYHVEMVVQEGGILVGKTVAAAGLSQLGYGYLAEIERGNELIQSPDAEFVLQANDLLAFIGAPRCAHELRSIEGLRPANDDIHKLGIVHYRRRLVEAVLSEEFPFLGMTLRECDFLSNYQAVVLSVSRGGTKLADKGLNVRLQAGDTLLMEAGKDFANQYRFRKDFMLVSALDNSSPPNFAKAKLALGILAVMVVLSALEIIPILEAAWLAAGVMLLTRCLNAGLARRSIDFTVLTVIGASFALGEAMTKTGAAQWIAQSVMEFGVESPLVALSLVYIMTSLFTEVITNNAAAALMFPIATSLASQFGVDIVPFAIAIMFAASASFMTPIGYQTNLMVYGPGGYRVSDYLKVGTPLNIMIGVVTISMIAWIWSLS